MSWESNSRREFIRTAGLGAISLAALGIQGACKVEQRQKTHIVSLSFDDGFKKSSIRTAEIYEKYQLSACINVIASAHENQFALPNEYHNWPVGDFELWNELQLKGHEIMPHGYRHANLTQMPIEEAKDLILKCFEVFHRELDGFKQEESIFNFPFNASNTQLEKLLRPMVRAVRAGGPGINKLPHKGLFRLSCTGMGPGNIDKHLERTVNELLSLPEGWLIYNTHGLDEEGWGPLSSTFLDELLSRLVQMDHVAVLPVGKALNSISI
jgi:peptidoglycan/xylan/chitin deacetylase (PgdA/CDA1 family)